MEDLAQVHTVSRQKSLFPLKIWKAYWCYACLQVADVDNETAETTGGHQGQDRSGSETQRRNL